MTYEQLEEFGDELNAVRQRVLDDLGQKDADYIRRVIKVQRAAEVLGRIGIFMPFFPPAFIAGILLLGLAKILDNMEIGHNIMHGQYDWMNDPMIDASRFEWDNIAPSQDWKHGHNYIHHTYTNIHGMDRDIGYNMFRIDEDQPWYASHRFNLPLAFILMLVFEWGIMYHGVELDQYLQGKITKEDFQGRRKRAMKKIRKQVFKDYVAWPVIGHRPRAVHRLVGTRSPSSAPTSSPTSSATSGPSSSSSAVTSRPRCRPSPRRTPRTRPAASGTSASCSARPTSPVGKPFHLMTGNLSHQIEHHLFPDIPARRYPEVAEDVKLLVEKYGLQYNTGRLSKQMFASSASSPSSARSPPIRYKIGNSPESKALRRAKREEATRRAEELRTPQLTS